MINRLYKLLFTTIVLVGLSACGGGGGGSSDGTTTTIYTVGGTVSGLTGSLVMQNNGSDSLTVSTDGSFVFSVALDDAASYSISMLTQPTGQSCSVTSGSGSITGENVSSVSITCSTVPTYTVGGVITGLTDTVVLQNNSGDDLTVTADGSFTFATALNDAASYSVSVPSQPIGQSCSVTSGSGTVSGANVTSVSITCSAVPTYTVGGTITGLTGTLGLQLIGTGVMDSLGTISNSFTFLKSLNDASTYSVNIISQPVGQICSVANGSGSITGANVTTVAVSCVSTYTIGGSVTGLTGSVVLQNNSGDNLTVSANGNFTFATALNDASAYSASVFSQPTGQTCSVTSGSGTITSADVTTITVSCIDTVVPTYTVGGSVTGLTGSVVLQNNSGDNLTLSANGSFTFATFINDTTNYSVSILTQPTGKTCAVTSGAGVVSGANITDISVTCSNVAYSIGGSVSGLNDTLILQNNAGDDLSINASGSFSFATSLEGGAVYDVDIESQPANYSCTVSNGSGVVGSTNVTNINVACSVRNIALSNLGITTNSPSIVVMPIHVSDKTTGLSISGLTTNDFSVLQDGSPVGVESFVSSKPVGDVNYAFRTVVVMDKSSSILATDFTAAKAALQSYVSNLQANQELAIYTFDDTVSLVQNFTSDQAVLSTAIDNIARGNASTNLYGAINTAAGNMNDVFNLNGVVYNSMVVITDGDDTSGYVSKATAQAAVQNKKAYVVPVGPAAVVGSPLYLSLVDIFGESQILLSTDFSVLESTLNTVRNNLIDYFKGLYYVYYASPSRSGTHTIDLSVVGNTNVASDNAVTGSFSASGFSSVVPNIVITGATSAYAGESLTWTVETEWSNDPANYTWTSTGINNPSILEVTASNAGATGTITAYDIGPGGDTISVYDNNWAISASQPLTLLPSRAPGVVEVVNSDYQENTVVWSAVTDATGYKVYWDTASGVTTASNQFAVTAFSTTHTGLPSGLTYYYRVATQFGEQESGLSTEVSAAVVIPTVTNLTIVSTPTQNDLSWSAVGTADYRIYWNTTGSPDTTDSYISIASGTTSYSHTGLDPAASYYYTVVAVDGGVLSTPSVTTDTVFSVSGLVSGLVGSGLTLQNNGADNVLVTGNTFSFPTEVSNSYGVTILTQPVDQTCSVSNGSGVATNDVSDITNVAVTCLNNYTVGGTVSGLTGSGLILQNNSGDDLARSAGGSFVFATTLPLSNTTYDVTILSQPVDQTCTVTNGSGTASSNVTNVAIECLDHYTVGGVVSGVLRTGLVLQNLAGDDLVISADGSFTFATKLAFTDTTYNVTVLTQPADQTCGVSNGSGLAASDITDVTIECIDLYYSVGGGVTGLERTGLVLQNNGGNDLTVPADGTYTFSQVIQPGTSYDVTVLNTPIDHSCVVTNGTGSSSVDVSNVSIECTANYPILTLDFGMKQLQFSWTPMVGATHYKLFENPDGVSGFTQVGTDIDSATTSAAIDIESIHRFDWPNASYMVSGCNGVECRDSDEVFTLGESAKAIGYFKASNTDSADLFGYSVVLSSDGNTMAVSAPSEDSAATGINGDQTDNSALQAGAVYVYTLSNGVWTQQAYIKASNTDANDGFGRIALSGDGTTLAVGASSERSAATGINGDQADDSLWAAGAVYIYTVSSGVWTQQAYVKASNTDAVDYFGSALSLSTDGNTLAVGAKGESSAATGINGDQTDNSADNSGAVYIFTRSSNIWSQQTYIKASNTDGSNGYGDDFGGTVKLSGDGNTLAVAAYTEDSAATGINGDQSDNSAQDSGAVYVFAFDGSIWSQQAYIKSSNTAVYEWFGRNAVTLSDTGNTLAVGATKFNNAGNGAVYLFNRNSGIWSQQVMLEASNPGYQDGFGSSVSLSGNGNTLAVGAYSEDSATKGINGDQADNSASSAGAVYLFSRASFLQTWSQESYIKASNTDAGDYFGRAVALNLDGSTLAVGTYSEASNASGLSGDQLDNSAVNAGAVYLY